jgi:methylthioribose-1-phosphate isomerase
MNVQGEALRTIFLADDGWRVTIIDQTALPHQFQLLHLSSLSEMATAISEMQVRGAPLIGAAASYGMALAMREDASDTMLSNAYNTLLATRPTAVNLHWALNEMKEVLVAIPESQREQAAYQKAAELCDEDVAMCSAIGDHGCQLIESLWEEKQKDKNNNGSSKQPVNILTHCNAGWLATVDWGTALSPIYKAHNAGIPVHVWVDETRPRNQGFNLTAWELAQHGVPHTIVVDNVGGHLMQHGQVDMCIVGTDRTTRSGDVCNKIGTYLKALAAFDNHIPFYVALPSPTIDWSIRDGVADIPIEERSSREVTHIIGLTKQGNTEEIQIAPDNSATINYGFDVTPARLITGLITERGVASRVVNNANSIDEASLEKSLAQLYPDKLPDKLPEKSFDQTLSESCEPMDSDNGALK